MSLLHINNYHTMSEEQYLSIIYNVLQIVGVIALFILCLICLYKRARAEERRTTNTAFNRGSKDECYPEKRS